MALPPFHTLGIIVQVLWGLYGMNPIAVYPATAFTPNSHPIMPTPANILDHIVRTGSKCLVIIPALLQIWAQDKKSYRDFSEPRIRRKYRDRSDLCTMTKKSDSSLIVLLRGKCPCEVG